MATLLRMPGVSADSDEALLAEWSVKPGSEIKEGEVVAAVETEKAVVDIEADQDAVVHTLLVEDGATVTVGDPIAVLTAPGEDAAEADALVAEIRGSSAAEAPAPAATAPEPAPAPALAAPAPAAPAPAASAPAASAPAAPAAAAPTAAGNGATSGRIFASPIVRKIARENGVDLAALTGTGPGGRIVRRDIEAHLAERAAAPAPAPAPAAPAPAPAPAPAAPAAVGAPAADEGRYTEVPHSKLRRLIASRLTQSKQQAPHFYLRATVRVDDLLALRAQVNEGAQTRVSVNDLVVKAVAKALVAVPEMNVVWTEDAVFQYRSADVAVAIASERGLVTPVLRDADTLSVSQISTRVRDFAARANEGRLQQQELEGGTFAVTNLGMFGVEEFSAIINPPHVGILAVGAATKQPVVDEDGDLTVGTTMTVTLSVDHRPVDGVVAARWLDALKTLLENPLQILL